MHKILLFITIFFVSLNANELVDALKGIKSQGHKDKQIITPVKQKPVCAGELIDAIEKNNFAFFKSKKGELKALNECLVSNDLSPMMMAAYADRGRIVKLFLDDGVSPDETNARNYTAAHFAAFYGNYEVMDILIAGGANINALNNVGQTPLMIAAFYGNAKTVKLLVSKGADSAIKDSGGLDAKELAEKKNKKDVLKILK